MDTNKQFTKDMISWQCTVVRFRNNMLGLAIRDKHSDNDHDGDEVFMIWDQNKKEFLSSQRLCNYDDNLRNTLSSSGLIKYIDSFVLKHEPDESMLSDSEWDVINVNIFPYAIDAFRSITHDSTTCWKYQINLVST